LGQIPPQHVVTKAYLTPQGMHLVSLTRNNAAIEDSVKDTILATFKEHVTIQSLEDAASQNLALSQARSGKDLFALGKGFEGWHLINSQEVENIVTETQFLPASFSVLSNPTEFLRIKVGSNQVFKLTSLNHLFEETKTMYQEQFKTKLDLNSISANDREKIFSFSLAQNGGYVNFVIRLVFEDSKWFDASVTVLSDHALGSSELAYWVEKLSFIHLK
jgi:hypothetical protein